MNLKYDTLTTRAECDAALAEVEFELKTYLTRDATGELADERADRTQASTSSQLARVEARIASSEAVLATAGIDDETRETTTDELAALRVQRTRLAKRQRQATGLARFLAAVDAEQVAQQVATLSSVKDGIAAHRATLAA
ncbi:hypothetical protein [Hymenobacter psychrotolerans]|uniref:Uncharacterized protein n=1 Tax=Hymenobacter psychrotolerans DSM 18569 TaxID=1121959 RepID=A0A1M6S631_9BACT|nr:hypothetical protein [Hymenobacter psychrotolerans]SHK39998.1 hypothetical protein SAMN02746009_00884 [Hymenobacter psychrotolerans DSM 18569]